MKKAIIAIIVGIVLVGGYFLSKKETSQPISSAPSVPQASNQQIVPQPSAPEPSNSVVTPPVTPSAPAKKASVPEKKVVVTYTDSGYAPSVLAVKKGETIIFKNQSSQSMWTASALHPSHRVYPTTGGCLGSTFDACSGIQPGESWSFKFDLIGAWKYHNHLNPGDNGTIVVE